MQIKEENKMIKLFDEIPLIQNEYTMLKRLTGNDIPLLEKMVSDDSVYRYLPTFLLERQYTDLHDFIHDLYTVHYAKKESLILGIYRSGRLCGLAEYYGYDAHMHKTCIGYRLSAENWGKGIATETAKLLVDYLYSRTDTEIITASTMIENHASARVLEKCGFIRTARAVPEDWGFEQPTIADKWFC